jgi:hypothetical protein
MTFPRLATRFGLSMSGVTVCMSLCAAPALADQDQAHGRRHDDQPGALVRIVKDATEPFTNVKDAMEAGYALMFGCVSGPDVGAMGLHYVNMAYVDGTLDPRQPEILIYEPLEGGGLKLIGADFIVFASTWHEAHPPTETPQMMGQLFHLFESPNRFGLPDFYTLHVWTRKENPNGAFVNWHPDVSCKFFNPIEAQPQN